MDAFEPVPLILGPTGVGKTRTAFQLALELGGAEIVSADARAVYRGMDIGTDKPSHDLRKRVPHHLVDIKNPDEAYSAMQFRTDAIRALENCRTRGIRAIVAGGSTLHADALLGKLFEGPSKDPALRQRLRAEPLADIYERLQNADPETAERLHPNDRQRIVRALEVYKLTGEPISVHQKRTPGPPYEFLKIGLTADREVLYERINRRVDQMIEEGLLEEASELLPHVPVGSQAYKSNGYREMFDYIRGEIASLDEAVRLMKKHTRGHARRQLKYFRRDPDIHWIDTTEKNAEVIADEILALLQSTAP
ncbi:MAG: tRNA (adenosine(37)-N6)-dimethylallyltransferase MiaA [Candidatus Bipolaricaulia bacterium]